MAQNGDYDGLSYVTVPIQWITETADGSTVTQNILLRKLSDGRLILDTNEVECLNSNELVLDADNQCQFTEISPEQAETDTINAAFYENTIEFVNENDIQIQNFPGINISQVEIVSTNNELFAGEHWNDLEKPDKTLESDVKEKDDDHINKSYSIVEGKPGVRYLRCKKTSELKGPGRPRRDGVIPPRKERVGPFKCQFCDLDYNIYALLRKHEKQHTDFKPHQCPKCPMSFNVLSNYVLHAATHASGIPKCPVCSKTFARHASLKAHLWLHSVEDNPICSNCSSMFHTQVQFDLHKKTCNVEQTAIAKEKPKLFVRPKRKEKAEKFPHKCSTCSKAFQKPSQLERHIRVHTGEKPYKCKICARCFNQKGSMEIHMASHSGIRPYACPLCPAKFSQKGNLQAHWRLHPQTSRSLSNYLSSVRKDGKFQMKLNNEVVTSGFPCTKCSCVFRKLSSLNAHNGRAHSEVKSSLEFNISNVMSDLAELQSVSSVNKDILQEALSNSGLDKKNDSFSSDKVQSPEAQTKNCVNNAANVVSSDITVFENSISGVMRGFTIKQRKIGNVKWHQCSFCGKEFKKPSDLIRHLRIHTKEKPFECPQCNRSFTVKSTLTAHIKTHLGNKAKRHTCPVCLKTFAATSSLSVHVRLHTGIKPHLCQYCDKAFRTAGLLRTHKYAHCSKKPPQSNEPEFTVVHMEEPIIITKNGFVQPQSKLAEVYGGSSVSRPHACSHCPAAYRKLSHLKQHMVVHTGERPFHCNICKRSFHNISMLKSHIQTHSGLRPFKCTQCDSVFSTSGSLKRHTASHSEQRNYMCPYCHKTFKTKVNCRRHMKTHRVEINSQLQSSMGLDQNNIIVTSVVPTNLQVTPENILSSTYEEQANDTNPSVVSDNVQIIHPNQILNLDQSNLEILQPHSNQNLEQTDNTNNLLLNVNLSAINTQETNLNCNQNLLQTNNLNQNLIIQNINNMNHSQIVNTNNINLNSDIMQNNNLITINNSTNQPIINNSNILENVISLNLPNDYILNTNNIKLVRENSVPLSDSVENVIIPDNMLDNSLTQNIDNLNFANNNLLLGNNLQSTKGLLTLVTKENGQHIILAPNILLQNQNNIQSDDNGHEISTNIASEQIIDESLKQQLLSIINEEYPNTNKFQFINNDNKTMDPKLTGQENENKTMNSYFQKVVNQVNNWTKNVTFDDSQETTVNRQIEIDLTNQYSENSAASDVCHSESALEKSNASVFQSIEDIWSQNEAINATNMTKFLPLKSSNFNKEKGCSDIIVQEAEENDSDMLIMADGMHSVGIQYTNQESSEKTSSFDAPPLHNESEGNNYNVCKSNVNDLYSDNIELENDESPTNNVNANEDLKSDELNKIINTKPFSLSISEKAFLESIDKKTRPDIESTVKHANQCESCPKSFRKPSDLIRHIRTHTGERPFACKICLKAFAVKSSLDTHMLTHSGVKQWKCHVCNSTLATRGSLKLHMRLHTGVKPFSCPLCDSKFRTSGHKTAHLLVHYREAKREGKNPEDIITRRNKNKGFISYAKQQLEDCLITQAGNTETISEKNNVPNEVKHIICDNNDGNYFEQNQNNILQNQTNGLPDNENGNEPIAIHIIPENTPTDSDVGNKLEPNHYNIPLQINLADFKITNFDQLGQFLLQPQTEAADNDHLPDIQCDVSEYGQSVHSIKREKVQHACEECGKVFSKPFQLVRHKRIHSGEKPYTCSICCKAFNQKNSLDTHMRHHTGERPHPCPYCSHSFTQKGNLKTHLNRNHAIEQSRAAIIQKLKTKQLQSEKICQNGVTELDSMVSPLAEFIH